MLSFTVYQHKLLTQARAFLQTSPRLVDAPLLEDETSVAVACGARHSVVLTGIRRCLLFFFLSFLRLLGYTESIIIYLNDILYTFC